MQIIKSLVALPIKSLRKNHQLLPHHQKLSQIRTSKRSLKSFNNILSKLEIWIWINMNFWFLKTSQDYFTKNNKKKNKCDSILISFNRLSTRKKAMASNFSYYQIFFCIFQTNFAMTTLGLNEMGKFLWEDREKILPSWLSQFSFAKLRQPLRQTFFPTFPKEFSHFIQT